MTFSFDQSFSLYQRALNSLAGGVSSHFRALGKPHPLFFVSGSGSRLFDADGNEYIDFTLGQGPLILGHSHPELVEAVCREVQKAQLYAGQFEDEVILAERLVENLPPSWRVRFCNSGSEAVHTALRLARAITGRTKIVKFEGQYHGWFDNILISVQPPLKKAGGADRPFPVPWSEGQPASVLKEIIVCPWNDLNALDKRLSRERDVAALITEPIMCNTSCIMPEPGFLEGLRAFCTRRNILLIFDEIITGFRLGPGGAQRFLGVEADLATYGKALAGGFPISVLAGKKAYMDAIADGRVMHAGTLNSNNTCVAAALATLEILARNEGEAYRQLFSRGETLKTGLQKAARSTGQNILIQGPGPMFHLGFTSRARVRNYREALDYDTEKQQRFTFEMLRRGVRLIGRGLWYVSVAHTEKDVEMALSAADDVFRIL